MNAFFLVLNKRVCMLSNVMPSKLETYIDRVPFGKEMYRVGFIDPLVNFSYFKKM